LAKGIDAIAHEWAIHSGTPNISVLATGILRTYPAKHADLAGKIVDHGGVLISEYLPDASPTSENFVWRNRLQAALSACVVAPEWRKSSGTAHTIRFARAFGRPTINLVAQGVAVPSDHGEASLTFNVPSEHAAFRQALISAFSRAIERPAKQAVLFG
jgi:predicted Rossmann fold nucleotide-binding protein DprA/Smf involved in DNA uptake